MSYHQPSQLVSQSFSWDNWIICFSQTQCLGAFLVEKPLNVLACFKAPSENRALFLLFIFFQHISKRKRSVPFLCHFYTPSRLFSQKCMNSFQLLNINESESAPGKGDNIIPCGIQLGKYQTLMLASVAIML